MKKDLREILLRKRDCIKPKEKEKKEGLIRKRFLALSDFKRAKSILFYASFKSEVNTIPCIEHALKLKKMVALPLVDRRKRELKLYKINDVSELKLGFMGILEPSISRERAVSLKGIDTIIIPGAGFDIKGNRLGYGHGYYDKLLSKYRKRPVTIALAFEEQIIPRIPKEIHDVKIDKIITDKRVIDCKKVESSK